MIPVYYRYAFYLINELQGLYVVPKLRMCGATKKLSSNDEYNKVNYILQYTVLYKCHKGIDKSITKYEIIYLLKENKFL